MKSNSLSFDSFLSSPHPQLSLYLLVAAEEKRKRTKTKLSFFSFLSYMNPPTISAFSKDIFGRCGRIHMKGKEKRKIKVTLITFSVLANTLFTGPEG